MKYFSIFHSTNFDLTEKINLKIDFRNKTTSNNTSLKNKHPIPEKPQKKTRNFPIGLYSILKYIIQQFPSSYLFVNTKQTGEHNSIFLPVSVNNPVFLSLLKITTLFVY